MYYINRLEHFQHILQKHLHCCTTSWSQENSHCHLQQFLHSREIAKHHESNFLNVFPYNAKLFFSLSGTAVEGKFFLNGRCWILLPHAPSVEKGLTPCATDGQHDTKTLFGNIQRSSRWCQKSTLWRGSTFILPYIVSCKEYTVGCSAHMHLNQATNKRAGQNRPCSHIPLIAPAVPCFRALCEGCVWNKRTIEKEIQRYSLFQQKIRLVLRNFTTDNRFKLF